MGYRCSHFRIEELVSRKTHERFGDRCWEFLNPKALISLDAFREEFGAIIVNNWHDGGPLEHCGLRDLYTPAMGGADFSIHKLGGAFDSHPQNVTPAEMHARILARPDRFQFVTCLEAIESTPTWVHADVRNHNQQSQIWVVQP